MLDKLCSNDRENADMSNFKKEEERILKEFKSIPLEEFHRNQKPDYKTVLERLSAVF